MTSLTLVVASAMLMVPREYHIDCSGWPGVVRGEFDMLVTARDDSVVKAGIIMEPNTTPEDVRDIIASQFEGTGWHYHKVGKGILVLEGAKKSAIRSVEFKSKDWKPDVRVGILLPKK